MGIGKLGRGARKVGLLIKGLVYIATAGRALVKAVRGRSEKAGNTLPDAEKDQAGEQDQFDQQ